MEGPVASFTKKRLPFITLLKTRKTSASIALAIGAVIAVLSLLLVPGLIFSSHAQERNPNIIFILADDLGYGDLSCYGQKRFTTPNIDRLATEGMKFTNHYAGAPVCAPSRSALMTGLHTGHTFIRGNKEVMPEGQWPLPGDSQTMLKMFKSAGYITGVFGKWGLGSPGSEGAPERQGVDNFFGYNCQRLAHNYYPAHLWENEQKIELGGNRGAAKGDYAPLLIHEKAMAFLETNKDKPFFLFYPMVIPHAELAAPEEYMSRFRGKFPPEEKFDGVDAGEPNYQTGGYGSQDEPHAAYAAMISLMDEQVGDVIRKIAALGLDENTLIIFTSDNGPHVEGGADPEYFDSNGILRGFKRDLYEGGIRVPMIVRWSGVIKGATVSEHISAFWDVMPTFADLLKIKTDKTDGISFLPTLKGDTRRQQQHKHLYWEFHEQGGRRALRQGDWKLVQYDWNKDVPAQFQLYNVRTDPSETKDVAATFPERVKSLKAVMVREHVPSPVFPLAAEKQ